MNKLSLSSTATLDPEYIYFAVAIQRSSIDPQLVGRTSSLPAPSASIVPFAVYGTLNVTADNLTDFRNQSQLANAQFPQGSYTVPWFMLS